MYELLDYYWDVKVTFNRLRLDHELIFRVNKTSPSYLIGYCLNKPVVVDNQLGGFLSLLGDEHDNLKVFVKEDHTADDWLKVELVP